MNIAFLTECDYEITPEGACDLVVFPFYTQKVISYNKEIRGESFFFKKLTNLSKRLKCTVVAGVDTDSYGSLRHSVAVCDMGKLVGISDLSIIAEGDKYVGGGGFRVYQTRAGKIGVAVGTDGLFSACVKSMSMCGADIIVNVSDPVLDSIVGISARAKAFEYGLPIAVCANKYAMLATLDGEVAFASPKKMTEASVRTDRSYSQICYKRRGKKIKNNF